MFLPVHLQLKHPLAFITTQFISQDLKSNVGQPPAFPAVPGLFVVWDGFAVDDSVVATLK